MINKIADKTKIDPSEIRQEFSDVHIRLLCCRYWILEDWQCMDLSVPFWRIYHNNVEGAKIQYSGEITYLNKDSLIIIPPNTAFSTSLNETSNSSYENIAGRKFERGDDIAAIARKNRTDHLFIHFSLGFPLDFAKAGIYIVPVSPHIQLLIEEIQASCMNDLSFTFAECLKIKQIINTCLFHLEESIWRFGTIDQRIFATMKFIERNFNKGITNMDLANIANMAVNSFSRLFRKSTGISVQQYILKTKIEAACNLMHHSNKTIDEIAYESGFFDRHHFSKIFKRTMKVNPAYYMKNLIIS